MKFAWICEKSIDRTTPVNAIPHIGPERPSWLSSLYRAQAAMDSGVRLAVRGESQLRLCPPTCAPGCSGCCSARSPLATAVEAAGAILHLCREGKGAVRTVLERVLAHESRGCPFLEGGLCSVYAMRPLSCRQLVVFGRACHPGEDPARARPGDVLTPLRGHSLRAYANIHQHLGAGPRARMADLVRPLVRLDPDDVLRLLGEAPSKAAA